VTGLLDGDTPSTKSAIGILSGLSQRKHVLVVAQRSDELTWQSLRNAPTVHMLVPDQLNTYDVLVSDDIVFTHEALLEFIAGPSTGRTVTASASESEIERASESEVDAVSETEAVTEGSDK
jgi:large subunit ribosomal protein L4